MRPEDLLAQLRAAFAADLADGLRVLEEGLVALEREEGDRRAARLREVFRAAHGLKGSARAAGLPAIEALCHEMESLLGAARDGGRPLGQGDMAALLAAVDALAEAQRGLADAGAADLEAPLAAAREGLRSVLAGKPGKGAAAETATAPSPPGVSPTETAASPPPATPGATPTPSAPATPTAPPTSTPTPTPAATATAPPTATPTATPTPTAAAPAPQPLSSPASSRRSAVRLPPERLDALAVASAALLGTAHQAELAAGRLEDLARDARRLRVRARAEVRAPGGHGGLEDDLRRHERALAAVRAQATQDARALERRTRRLAADVRALRLTPWTDATAGLERTARDLAARRGVEVELRVEAEALEIDRAVLDVLREPLAQLVSNAVAHAIEPPAERRAAGKPPRGRITLGARVERERLVVTVEDDGRGLDPAKLREEARRRGLPAPAEPRRALELLFLPGFTTAGAVTEEAGRGVGLDVVATAVRQRRGAIAVGSTPGQGTLFELSLPATLWGVRAVLARDAGQLLAVPALDVERVVRVLPDRVGRMDGRPVLLGGEPLPLAPLGHAVGLGAGAWDVTERRTALVVAAGGRRAAFAVEEVIAERELALEPLPRRAEVPLASAVSVLPGGGLAIVLATERLLEAAGGAAPPAAPRPAERRRRRILLADDAATTRALGRSILEAAGYDVLVAPDGEQALALLRQHGADAVVSDVEMPGLDGFELARAIRGSPRLARLPVVLLTALAADADRRRGLEAGASAYLVKSTFDQRQLLDTLAELLGEVT